METGSSSSGALIAVTIRAASLLAFLCAGDSNAQQDEVAEKEEVKGQHQPQ